MQVHSRFELDSLRIALRVTMATFQEATNHIYLSIYFFYTNNSNLAQIKE